MTTSHKVTLDRGPHVVDGVVQWFSVTVLTAADEESVGGCLLKHWFTYVDPNRAEAPPTKAQGIGIVTHGHLEKHLKGEEVVLSPLELKMLAAAGDIPKTALVEAPVGELVLAEGADPVRMQCAGVDFFGHADVIIPPREGEVEVLDWKTTKSINKWAKIGEELRDTLQTGEELRDTLQMLAYGEWAARRFGARRVRLTHVYGQTEGAVRAERRSVIVERDEIADGWNRVQDVGRRVIRTAQLKTADEVPGNPEACGAYGGCPFRAKCKIGRRTMLMGIMSRMKSPAEPAPMKKDAPAPEKPTETDVRAQIAALEAEAEKCRAQMEAPQVTPPDAPPSEHPLPEGEGKKKGKGRPKGSRNKPKEKPAGIDSEIALRDANGELAGLGEDVETTPEFPTGRTIVPKGDGFLLEVYVDTVQTFPTESLHPYLAKLCRQLCDAHELLDVRAAPGSSDLGFGKWKGYLAEAIRQAPPVGGSYSLDTRGSEIAEVAADVFRDIAPVFVRGIR